MTTTPIQADPQRRPARRKLSVGLARSEWDVIEAQRLRYRVFAEELGARLPTTVPGIDQDIYDPFCQHLVVRDDAEGCVVGTYRILSPENARRIGNYYSENEFDLTRLQLLRPRLVEIGRSCVHPDYRSGATIALLWSGARAVHAGTQPRLSDRLRQHRHGRRRACRRQPVRPPRRIHEPAGIPGVPALPAAARRPAPRRAGPNCRR